jgi:glycosyltransferase involved in cell wall biosynthesis
VLTGEGAENRLVEDSFSVIIPLFNKQEYICRAIDSVLRQTKKPEEIIVVDDGSTDDGARLVSRYLDKRILLHRQENKGVGAARNAGVAKATKSLVAFLDADDAWLSHHLEELDKLSMKFSECGLLSTGYIEQSTDDPFPDNLVQASPIIRGRVDYFSQASRNPGFVWSSAVAVRRNVFDKLGGFGTERVGEDTEFWVRVALDYPVAASSRITSVYYRGTGGVIEGLGNNSAPSARVGSLAEVAPALRTLCERAKTDQALFKSGSVRAYVNGRLLLGIKSNLLQGNFPRARSFSVLMLKSIEMRFVFWRFLFLFPDSFIKAAIWLQQQLKRLK